jgi:hypothetical protein
MEVSVNASDSKCLFVGVDLGDERFQVCVVESTGASGEHTPEEQGRLDAVRDPRAVAGDIAGWA